MNLIELQKLAEMGGDKVAAMVVQNFVEQDQLLSAMNFSSVAVGNMGAMWNEEKTLPEVGTRSVNEDFTTGNGETVRKQESLKIYGGKIGVDRALVGQLGNAAVAAKVDAQIKALRSKIANDVFNGSSATDAEQFDGLKTFLPLGATGRIDNGYRVNNGGGALSIKNLDAAIAEVDTGNQVIFANKRVKMYINQYAQSLVTFDKNDFGVAVPRYGDIPIIDIDRNNLNVDILGFGESGSTSSLFVCNIGEEALTMLTGARGLYTTTAKQGEAIGENSVEWLIAMALKGEYNAARLSGFTATSAVA